MSTLHRPRRIDPDAWRCSRALGHLLRPGEGRCVACGVRVHYDDRRVWIPEPDVEPDGLGVPHLNPTTLEPEDWPYADR